MLFSILLLQWLLVYQDTNGYVSPFFSVGTHFLGVTKLILQHGPTNDIMQYEVANGKDSSINSKM